MPAGLQPPPGPAEGGAEARRSGGSPVKAFLRAVLGAPVVATLVGLAFVVVFLDAFHASRPHALPVAVVGTPQQLTQVSPALEKQAPGQFRVRRLPDEPAARTAVLHREVYGALVPGPPPRLLVAGANGQAVTMTLTEAFSPMAQALGGVRRPQDLRPLAPGDTRGLGIFYGAFGVVLGGFIFGLLSYQAAPKLQLRWRSWACGPWARGHVRALDRPDDARQRHQHGNLPAEYLPPWLHPLSFVLPPGVAVRALRGATYFAGDGVAQAAWVLALWSVVPLVLIGVLDAISRRRHASA